MTEFSLKVTKCIAEWGKRSADCKGNVQCLEDCAKQLRGCLDIAFPDSKRIEFEGDKVNYLLSAIFFLASRISKASIGLAEFDRVMGDMNNIGKVSLENDENRELYEKMKQQLDEIIAKYF